MTIEDMKFLAAWQRGVKLMGDEFFKLTCDVDDATNKRDLEPNYEFIKKTIGVRSHGQQVFIALMYSFYNDEDGQELLEIAGTPNFVDTLSVIDLEQKKIISDLWLNYSGW